MKLARLSGYVLRRYANPETKDVVTVLLVCGKPGPVAVHTPDVCFQGAGARMTAGPDRQALEGSEFWAGRFDVAGSPPANVLWAWSAAGGPWEAPDRPRGHFARSKALFKMYLIHSTALVTGPPVAPGADPVLAAFARDVLPAVRAALAPDARPLTPPAVPPMYSHPRFRNA